MLRENGNPDYVLSADCVLHYLETPKLRKEPARLAYEARQKFLHDQASYLSNARREGIEEGLEKGLEKGRAEGVREKALETTKKLLPSGLSVEQIAEATGLSVEDVEKIKKTAGGQEET